MGGDGGGTPPSPRASNPTLNRCRTSQVSPSAPCTSVLRWLLPLVLLPAAGFAQGQNPSPQNPSPMTEHAREHPRLIEQAPPGVRIALAAGEGRGQCAEGYRDAKPGKTHNHSTPRRPGSAAAPASHTTPALHQNPQSPTKQTKLKAQ